MNKLKEWWAIILIIIFVLGINFYWTEIKPYQIKKSCGESASPFQFADEFYKNCIRQKGL